MNEGLVTRREAAQMMGISECTLSRCVKLGAPVHRRGSTGHRYLVNVPNFVKWMEAQNYRQVKEKAEKRAHMLTVEEMAARRQAYMRELRKAK